MGSRTWYFFQSLLSFFVFSAASSARLLNLWLTAVASSSMRAISAAAAASSARLHSHTGDLLAHLLPSIQPL
jgi:hypothetical protein